MQGLGAHQLERSSWGAQEGTQGLGCRGWAQGPQGSLQLERTDWGAPGRALQLGRAGEGARAGARQPGAPPRPGCPAADGGRRLPSEKPCARRPCNLMFFCPAPRGLFPLPRQRRAPQPFLSPRPAPRPPRAAPRPAAPPGRPRRGTLCKCNLSAGPASARKPRARLPGTRGGALGAGRRPVNQRRLTIRQRRRPAGLGPSASRRLCARSLRARSLFPAARPLVPARGFATPSRPLLAGARVFPASASLPGPVFPELSPSLQIASFSLPFLLENREYGKRGPFTPFPASLLCGSWAPQCSPRYHLPHRLPRISGAFPPP